MAGNSFPYSLAIRFRFVGLFALVVVALVGIERSGALRSAENAILEARMAAAPRAPTGAIVLIGIDRRSIRSMGNWPWPRDVYAEIIDRLFESGATEIFLDIDFSSPSTPQSDAALAGALATAEGTVILPAFQQHEAIGAPEPGPNLPLPEFREHSWIASVNVRPDPDGRVRQYLWGQFIEGEEVPSAASELAGAFGPADASFPINFSLNPRGIPAYSAIDLIEGRVAPESFEGRSVVVGAHALELRDQFTVPVHGVVNGSALQVLAAETLIQGIRPIFLHKALPFLFATLVAVGLALSPMGRRPLLLAGTYTAFALTTEVAAFLLFSSSAVVLPTLHVHAIFVGCGLVVGASELGVRRWLVYFSGIERRNSESVLHQVITDSSDAIVVSDESGSIIQISDRAYDLFDIPRSGDRPQDLEALLPEEMARATRGAIEAHCASGMAPSVAGESKFSRGGKSVQVEYVVKLSKIERSSRRRCVSNEAVLACMTARDVTLAREHEARLDKLARYDALTGAMNRGEFISRVAEGLRAEGQTVLALNLHRFQTINSTLGRTAGDELLRALVDRLSDVPTLSGVARLGGDVFALFCPATDADGAQRLAEDILLVVSEPFELNGALVSIDTRIGVAISSPGSDAETLLSKAEVALDSARSAAGEGIQFYQPETLARQARSRQLERGLASAIEKGELYLDYQPQFDLESSAAIGAEALLRWRHPVLGQVSPAEFIAIAESCGFIEKFGRWVLKRACRDAVSWPSHVIVAVNVSALQFQRGDLLADVRSALAESNLHPTRLQLEITESVFVDSSAQLVAKLDALRGMGISIALDDFGAGFSSLGYLSKIPLDKLKLDRALARDVEAGGRGESILKSTVVLAQGLGLTLLCEGIETEDQLDRLRALGCSQGQGYLLGKPEPKERLVDLLYAESQDESLLYA